MRILVMIKRVCEPESLFDLKDGRPVLRQPARHRMGLYSEYALETGLALAEERGGEVTAMTVGAKEDQDILTRAAGMGAGHTACMECSDETATQPMAVAAMAAAWAAEQGFDLILAGVMSEDAMHGVVGPAMAELMGLPLATSVVEVVPGGEAGRLLAVREMEGGLRQEVDLPLPAVVTIQSSANQPRYPTLSRLLAAKKRKPMVVVPPGLTPRPSGERFLGADLPQKSRAGVILSGSTADKAAALAATLKERGLL